MDDLLAVVIMNWKRFKSFIFDLDGTLWNCEEVFEEVPSLMEKLKERAQVLIATNHTYFPKKEVWKKLKKAGIGIEMEEIVSVGDVAKILFEGEKVCVLGEGLKKELEGFEFADEKKEFSKHIIIAHDENFDYQKLQNVCECVKKGCEIYTTSLGDFLIFGKSEKISAGMLAKIVELVSGKKPKLIGKPSDDFCYLLDLKLSAPKNEAVVIGDEESDVLLGKKLGCYTVLVKSKLFKKPKGKIRPNKLISSLAQIKI